jgi:hypothetical protein
VDSPRIIYASRPDVTPESELAALVNVYSFVLQCAQGKKKGGPATAPDDSKEIENARDAAKIAPE